MGTKHTTQHKQAMFTWFGCKDATYVHGERLHYVEEMGYKQRLKMSSLNSLSHSLDSQQRRKRIGYKNIHSTLSLIHNKRSTNNCSNTERQGQQPNTY